MPRYIYYAMEEETLQGYIDHKNLISEQSINLSAEEVSRIKLELEEFRVNDRVLFTIDGNTASMNISGVLEPKPDPCAIMFGFDMTTYSDIINGISEAEANPAIENMKLFFDTPGGNIVGLFKACDSVRNSSLNITGIVVGMAASAGYALLSQCDRIELENESNEVGSIGVRTDRIDRTEQDRQNGVVRHTLVSENAPNKVSDISTEKGRLQVIERITKFESVFIDYVAIGRNTTAENVKENFGKGGMLIAREALQAGMIDNIISTINKPVALSDVKSPVSITGQTETLEQGDNMADITMSEEDFQAKIEAAANGAAEKTAEKLTATFEADRKAEAAEAERKSGFSALLAAYPEQASMINDEIAKEDAHATAEFALKVGSAEKSRLSAAAELEAAAKEKTGETGTKTNASEKNSGDTFMSEFKGAM